MKRLWLLGLFIFLFVFGKSQNKIIDSLIAVLKIQKEDTNKVNLLYQISEASEVDDILKYAEFALKLAQKLNYNRGIAGASNNIGFVYMNKGDIPEALEWYNKSLMMWEKVGDKHGIAIELNNIANIYDNFGDNSKALEFNFKSLKICEETGDKQGIARSLNNIGTIYHSQGNLPKGEGGIIEALEYYYKSLKYFEEAGDRSGVGSSYNNIAAIYESQGDNQKALEWYTKSFNIQEEIGDKQNAAYLLINIGDVYDVQHNFEKGLELYNKSLAFLQEIGDKNGLAHVLNNIGGIYLNKAKWISNTSPRKLSALQISEVVKNYNQAADYSNRALKIGKELGYPENIRNSSKQLSSIYKFLGTSPQTPLPKKIAYLTNALEMYELFKQMADSINNVQTRKSGLKKQMQYAFEKKETETKAEQEKKDVIANEELHKQKVVRNSFIGGFCLVLVLAIVVFRSYRQKQKANIEITAQKHTIEEKQKEILDSIHYAKRIQTALITSEKYISKNLEKLNYLK